MDIFINNLPSLDLHGYDRDSAKLAINDFIKDNIYMNNDYIVIIHGRGTGIIKKITHDTLKKNRYVEEFKIPFDNDGCTLVKLRFDKF